MTAWHIFRVRDGVFTVYHHGSLVGVVGRFSDRCRPAIAGRWWVSADCMPADWRRTFECRDEAVEALRAAWWSRCIANGRKGV